MTDNPPGVVDASDRRGLLTLLQAVCEQSSTGLLVFDPQLRYLLVNQQMAVMANTPAETLLGRTVREAFPEYAALTTRIEHVLATGEPMVAFDVSGSTPGVVGDQRVWSLSAYRLMADDGTVLGVAVTSSDVTAARALEQERAVLAERLSLLAASSELLSSGLDEQATIDGVLQLMVPAVAEWACLHLLDDGTVRLAAARHHDPHRQELLDRVLSGFRVTLEQPVGAGRVLATGLAQDVPEVTDSLLAELAGDDPRMLADFRSLQVRHGVVVPLAARGETFGALTLSLPADPDRAGAAAATARRELVADVAARAALALDSARVYARQHEVAITLQRSLLPRSLPDPDGLEISAAYLPGAAGTEVGGDFYEAVVRSDGRLAFAIGDVMGRGVRAAAVMGQVRAALRGYALEGHRPEAVLRRLNVMVAAMEESSIVTCLVGVLDIGTGQVELASAGHPPPVLLQPGLPSRSLRCEPGPPLGVLGAQYAASTGRVSAGAALVLYTDGLVESREQPVDEGIAALCSLLDRVASTAGEDRISAERVCQAVIDGMGRSPGTVDDVAVLTVCRS